MTNLAFQATYADWKLIKTRSVVQVVFEIPVENSNAVLEVVGGMPDGTRWFGIAPLRSPQAEKENVKALPFVSPAKPSLAKEPEKAKRAWRDMSPSSQSGTLCNEPTFRAFLLEECGFDTIDKDQAAIVVRQLCKVESRKEFDIDPRAKLRWQALDDQYQAWKALEHA